MRGTQALGLLSRVWERRGENRGCPGASLGPGSRTRQPRAEGAVRAGRQARRPDMKRRLACWPPALALSVGPSKSSGRSVASAESGRPTWTPGWGGGVTVARAVCRDPRILARENRRPRRWGRRAQREGHGQAAGQWPAEESHWFYFRCDNGIGVGF